MLAEPVISIGPIIVRPTTRPLLQTYVPEPETTRRECAIVNFDWPQTLASGQGALILQKTHGYNVWLANGVLPPTSSENPKWSFGMAWYLCGRC